jgi:ABC-type enterobactin transport system permease subunit
LASLGLLVAVVNLLRHSDGPAEPFRWVYVGVGVSAFVQGLVLWGLSAAIVELKKIRAVMQNERNQDTD